MTVTTVSAWGWESLGWASAAWIVSQFWQMAGWLQVTVGTEGHMDARFPIGVHAGWGVSSSWSEKGSLCPWLSNGGCVPVSWGECTPGRDMRRHVSPLLSMCYSPLCGTHVGGGSTHVCTHTCIKHMARARQTPSSPRCMTKNNLCTHLSPSLHPSPLWLFSLSLSVSCFLASSGRSEQESSPNDGIKRVRKMTEREKEEECGRQLFAPQHPQIQRKKKRKRERETARDSVPLVSRLCLFLAAVLLPSVDQTNGVEG